MLLIEPHDAVLVFNSASRTTTVSLDSINFDERMMITLLLSSVRSCYFGSKLTKPTVRISTWNKKSSK